MKCPILRKRRKMVLERRGRDPCKPSCKLMAFLRPQCLRCPSMPEDCYAHKHAPRQETFQSVVNQFEESGGLKGRLIGLFLLVGDYIIWI